MTADRPTLDDLRHELYVWVIDYDGDGHYAFALAAPIYTDGRDNHQAALNGDPRIHDHVDRTKARAALVKITVPFAEMRRVDE